MKILLVTSRYTANRDIIDEDFGRQTRLFSALRNYNHTIHFFCADYRKKERKDTKLNGMDIFIRPFGLFSFPKFFAGLDRIIKKNKYDIIIGSSDPLWGLLGYIVSRKNKTKFVYDLHDNYEVYATYRLPLFKIIDNHVIRKSDGVTTVSFSLKEKIDKIRKDKVKVIENGVSLFTFKKEDKGKCRNRLNLPSKSKIIAYAGSIQRRQGIDILLKAFKDIRSSDKNVIMVIAGRFLKGESKHINLKQEGVMYLGGDLKQKDINCLINSSDVAVIPNKANDFTNYCFPYKILEYMATGSNIAATKVGDIRYLMKDYKDSLCEPNDVKSLKDAIKRQLNSKRKKDYSSIKRYRWSFIAGKLDKFLSEEV